MPPRKKTTADRKREDEERKKREAEEARKAEEARQAAENQCFKLGPIPKEYGMSIHCLRVSIRS
jgi:hypothetical protein